MSTQDQTEIPANRVTWTQKYLKEVIADEIELARLLRYGKVKRPTQLNQFAMLYRDAGARGASGLAGADHSTLTSPLPQWRRNWSAAGPLSTKLFMQVRHDTEEGTVSAGASDRRRSVTEAYADHPSVDAATWAAISRAAIQLLTEARDSN